MEKSKIYKNLPILIKSILLTSEGWLVGGAPWDLMNDRVPKDYDVIVPSAELFQIVVKQLSSYDNLSTTINTFGGLKFTDKDVQGETLDIWCEELDHFIKTANKFGYAFNLKRNVLIVNHD